MSLNSMVELELKAAYAWQQASGRPVFNVLSCATGGLTRAQWVGVAEQARALAAKVVA